MKQQDSASGAIVVRKFHKPHNAAEWLELVMNAVFFLCGILAVGWRRPDHRVHGHFGPAAIGEIGIVNFLFGQEWASTAAEPKFGILPFILSCVYGTLGAIIIGIPVGLLTAVFLSKAATPKLRTAATSAIELLSGIPSVIFGLLGMQLPGARRGRGVWPGLGRLPAQRHSGFEHHDPAQHRLGVGHGPERRPPGI